MKSKIIYDECGKAIGKVDENGGIYTMNNKPSYPYIQQRAGVAINKLHMKRELLAREISFDE